jgi:beta-glucuronidase
VRELAWYDGMVWFRRTFDADPAPGRRYFLYFEAVNYHAHVYLNGAKLGEHEGGFTPFAFEVTAQLARGRNSIVAAADSRHHERSLPNVDFDWQNYGGITRPVHLIDVPETYVHSHRVWLAPDGQIRGEIRLAGPGAAGAPVELHARELGFSLRGRADSAGYAVLTGRPRSLVRWSPRNPRLYEIELRGAQDRMVERIGFRTIEARGPQLFLNGERLVLRGIAMHEESLGSNPTRALSWAAARALLEEAKALGANFVRLAHYPHTEKMTRLADELGLLVWSEIPVYWEMNYSDPKLLALGRRMLAEMIVRDVNRASVVVWAVANETPVEEARNAFLRTLIDDARALDPTRLVAAALDLKPGQETPDGARGVVRVDDPIGAHLDLLGFNRYDGWYGDLTPDQIDSVRWMTVYDKPLMLSEFGADALRGLRGDRTARWTEDYQAFVFEGFLRMTERIPGFAGLSPWLLKDFRSPRRYHGRYQDYWNRKGLIDPNGERKIAFDVLRRHYESMARTEAARRAAR